jgi:hypothetical protein
VQVAEYLAMSMLREIERGAYTDQDLRDRPDVECLAQVAMDLENRGLKPPEHVAKVLAKLRPSAES